MSSSLRRPILEAIAERKCNAMKCTDEYLFLFCSTQQLMKPCAPQLRGVQVSPCDLRLPAFQSPFCALRTIRCECTSMAFVLEVFAFCLLATAMHVRHTVQRFEPAQGLERTHMKHTVAKRESWGLTSEVQQSPIRLASVFKVHYPKPLQMCACSEPFSP